jgi:hypothetical protein
MSVNDFEVGDTEIEIKASYCEMVERCQGFVGISVTDLK